MDKTASGHTLKIVADQDASSPRDACNLGTLACWHRRYTLGDIQPNQDPREYQAQLADKTLVVPVYMMDHSGLALSTRDFGDPWDSGQVGIYHVTPQQLIDAYGEDTLETRARARDSIQAELEVYTDYLNGNCWGYVVEDAEGEHVDSCFGFIGSDAAANGIAEHLADEYLPLLEQAAEAAGACCSRKGLDQIMAQRAEAAVRKNSPSP